MISQVFPTAVPGSSRGFTAVRQVLPREWVSPASHPAGRARGYGPFRVQLHVAARREGTRVDPGALPRGAGARCLRRPLLLSGARPARGGCRRQRAARRDRDADCTLSALFGRTRRFHVGALRHERDLQDRRRGTGDPFGCAEGACRDRRRGRLRRSRPQVSDLGAWTLPRATRGGHRDGARAQEATGLPGGGARRAKSTGMMAGSDGTRAVAGGLARHVPVLGRAVAEYLHARDGGVYVDGTFGAGGHTRAILESADTRVIGIDRDQSAVAGGFGLVEQAAGRLVLVEDRFANLEAVAHSQGHDAVDGVLLDLGVSSMQLDEAGRGFSFRHDGPLDMRMGGEGPSAADVVARASERDLSFIIATLGEERFARPIARAIVKARAEQPITTTDELSRIIGTVLHQRLGEIHPSTRTFQALRIFVNDELGELAAALGA